MNFLKTPSLKRKLPYFPLYRFDHWRTVGKTTSRRWGLVVDFIDDPNFTPQVPTDETHRRAVTLLMGCWLVRRLATARQCWSLSWYLPLGPSWGSYVVSYRDISTANMFIYDFRTYHMSFIQNEHVKLDKIYIDTEGHFKENLSNVMDVLKRFTSKLYETWHTDFKNYTN